MVQTNGKDKKPLGEGDKDNRKKEGIKTLNDLYKKSALVIRNKRNGND